MPPSDVYRAGYLAVAHQLRAVSQVHKDGVGIGEQRPSLLCRVFTLEFACATKSLTLFIALFLHLNFPTKSNSWVTEWQKYDAIRPVPRRV
jgi:hypothetical protein